MCDANGIVLIFDEIFVGFRLAAGGAQEYYGVRADMVTYGKTLGGGLPVGVLCGRRNLMKRYRDDRPADICFARGTFSANPYVMGAMDAFLRRLATPECQALYKGQARSYFEINRRARRKRARRRPTCRSRSGGTPASLPAFPFSDRPRGFRSTCAPRAN